MGQATHSERKKAKVKSHLKTELFQYFQKVIDRKEAVGKTDSGAFVYASS